MDQKRPSAARDAPANFNHGMSTDSYVLAIDLGTSGPKVALVSSTGSVLGSGFAPVDLLLSPGGGAEQDPAAWWEAISTASRKVLTTGLAPLEQIHAISVTAQWSGTVAVDSDGEAIGNAIIWMDSRGAPHIEKLIGGPVRVRGTTRAS